MGVDIFALMNERFVHIISTAVASKASVKLGALVCLSVMLLSAACISLNWQRHSLTIDEPNHVASGLQWLEHGTYTLWTENPPLVRVSMALLPWVDCARLGPRAASPLLNPMEAWGMG